MSGQVTDKFATFVCSLIIVVISVTKHVDSIQPPQPSGGMLVVANPSPPSAEPGKRVPKQVGAMGGALMNRNKDQQSAAGYHHDHHHMHHGMQGHGMHGMHGHGDSKYFQYAHSPHYDEYEYGYRRGNDYHFQERYEKYGPAWNFKTKVKWGDKHAGYGEHYWDYNHAGHGHDGYDGGSGGGGDGGGGSGGGGGGGGEGHYSEPVPRYEHAQSSDKRQMLAKRENHKESKRLVGGVKTKYEDNQASSTQQSAYKEAKQDSYGERERVSQIPRPIPSLMLDTQSGRIIDESTGKAYWLKPAA